MYHVARKPEIDQFRPPEPIKHQVPGLQVPVYDTHAVAQRYALGELQHQLQRPPEAERKEGGDAVQRGRFLEVREGLLAGREGDNRPEDTEARSKQGEGGGDAVEGVAWEPMVACRGRNHLPNLQKAQKWREPRPCRARRTLRQA